MSEIPLKSLEYFPEDSDGSAAYHMASSETLRMVVCMTPSQSRHLLDAQYLQSDIAFKRVVGYYEFELAGWDPINLIGNNFNFFIYSSDMKH
jgi:hypothetical protein